MRQLTDRGSSLRIRGALASALLLASCATARPAPTPDELAVDRALHAFVAGAPMRIDAGNSYLGNDPRREVIAQPALVAALSRRGLHSTASSPNFLRIAVNALDDSQLRSGRAVSVGFVVFSSVDGVTAGPAAWGPRTIRLQNHAAEYDLESYLSEAFGRLLDDGFARN